MKHLLVAAASTLALAACAPAQKAPRAALDCPQSQGELRRTGVAADGKSCSYRTARGDEVTLQLVATGGDPDRALRGIEAQLVAQAGQGAETRAADAAQAGRDVAASTADAQRTAAEAQRDAEAAAAAADRADGDDPDPDADMDVDIHVNKDGKTIVSRKDGDKARIDLPGIHINAEDEKADVRIGGIHINAEDGAATVRVRRDVRLQGEAFSRQKRGVRATYILAGDEMAGGFRAVGYEAGGPKSGPLAVAVVRAKESEHDGDIYKDIKRLVRRNGGV